MFRARIRSSPVSRRRYTACAPDPTAIAEVRKESFPEGALAIGTQLMVRSEEGSTSMVRVKELKEQTVILDLNHPLAGQTLYFDIKILNVEAPSEE